MEVRLYFDKAEVAELTTLSERTIEEEIRHDRVYTERQMPEATGIDLPRLRRLIESRQFPPARIMEGGAVGWSVREVQQWEEDRLKGIVWRPARTNVHRPTELYRHFDARGRLLYVGIAISTTARLRGHKVNAKWLDQVTTITIERFPTRADAEDAERAAIRAEKPLHNIAHAGKS